MKCNHCQAELEENVTVCPACGKEVEQAAPVEEAVPAAEAAVVEEAAPAEETAPVQEKKEPEIKEGIKATPGKIAIAIAAGVVLLAVLVALVVSGLNGGTQEPSSADSTVAATEDVTVDETVPVEAVEATSPADTLADDVTHKGSYTVSDEVLNAAVDTVVATIGDAELTLGQLQVYYWENVYAFYQQYGSYATIFGLDFTQDLDTQMCQLEETPMTWQQYFLKYSLENWHNLQVMTLEGQENGYQLSDDMQAELDALPEDLALMASSYGYESLDAMMYDYIGPGCSAADYEAYAYTYYHGFGYYDELYLQLVPSEDEVNAYFTENEADYTASGVTKDGGKYVDVRHILLMPENGTTGEDGYPVYTDEDWAACKEEVDEIYAQWQKGDLSEDSFGEFAKLYSVDSSASTGGLYTDVTEGYMVENFNDWCFDESRKPGDHDLVQTQYGYHIMYFVQSRDIWYVTAEADLQSRLITEKVEEALERRPMKVDYSAIMLGYIPFG